MLVNIPSQDISRELWFSSRRANLWGLANSWTRIHL